MPRYGAIALCAHAARGSICLGDSGAALVQAGSGTIVGVASGGPANCAVGSNAFYAWVGAPEILSFIRGNDHPPVAPRVTSSTYVRLDGPAVPRPGSQLTCGSARWVGNPTLSYAFLDPRSGHVFQTGPRTAFTIPRTAMGDAILCRATGTTPGGTLTLPSEPSPTVA